MDKISGVLYVLGDNINTDDIIPSHSLTMRDSNEMAKHTLEYIDPKFIKKVTKNTIILAGENFGTGSSREEAVNVFKLLGIKIIVAKSFARIYYRNLINKGIPAIELKWKEKDFSDGDSVEISLIKGEILNNTNSLTVKFSKLPSFLATILEEGGILNQLKKSLNTKN